MDCYSTEQVAYRELPIIAFNREPDGYQKTLLSDCGGACRTCVTRDWNVFLFVHFLECMVP